MHYIPVTKRKRNLSSQLMEQPRETEPGYFLSWTEVCLEFPLCVYYRLRTPDFQRKLPVYYQNEYMHVRKLLLICRLLDVCKTVILTQHTVSSSRTKGSNEKSESKHDQLRNKSLWYAVYVPTFALLLLLSLWYFSEAFVRLSAALRGYKDNVIIFFSLSPSRFLSLAPSLRVYFSNQRGSQSVDHTTKEDKPCGM